MLKRKIVCVRVRADQPFFSGGFRLFRRRRENVCACECRKFVCVFHQFTVLFDKNGRKYGRNSIQENIRMKI